MTKRAGVMTLAAAGAFAFGGSYAMAAHIGVTPTKLIVVDKLTAAGKAKAVFVAKDPAVDKGAGTDVNDISVQLSINYDNGIENISGAFVVPAGASNGTEGWLVNKTAVAKFVNKSAPSGSTVTKVSVFKQNNLVKLVGKDRGDTPLDILNAGSASSGTAETAYCVVNGGTDNCFCSTLPCVWKSIAGDTGAKLVCKGGAPDGACPAAGPSLPFHYIFVTSGTYDGNLGGLSGADAKCQARAAAAALPGTYIAFLGATGVNAADRLGDFELRLTDGITVVANNKADLLDGSLDAPISKDQTGADVSGSAQVKVWTAALSDGTYYGQNCNTAGGPDWSTTSARTLTGIATSTTVAWATGGDIQPCASLLRLYCIQQ